MAKYNVLMEGNRTYARCKGVVGHKWDDFPGYDRQPPNWAVDRMVFRCLECKVVKVYYRERGGYWLAPRYYNRPSDWNAVQMPRGSRSQDWKDAYFQAFWKNGKG